ncbi:MAG: hypothetical protein KYX69_18490 [Sphingomonas sp.]|uniref:hypothetical protein n=1 Tax=Sphingomonas sp. TaxID=28214 RepID=UPI00262614AF|nr:hypothetical protein [Sphingomonas sp.]MDK2769698.1 hypothetical protein [Sphingomonas sp.]
MLKGFDFLVRRRLRLGAAAMLLASLAATPALAQEVGENRAWQFEAPQDLAARAAVADLIARARGGLYAAPVYNTTIARQYNCSVAASAVGNSGAQSAVAKSPTVTGATSAATGNQNSASAGDRADLALDQRNLGPVASTAIGSTAATADGPAWQALNSSQSNSGDQRASVQDSTACGFGAIN